MCQGTPVTRSKTREAGATEFTLRHYFRKPRPEPNKKGRFLNWKSNLLPTHRRRRMSNQSLSVPRQYRLSEKSKTDDPIWVTLISALYRVYPLWLGLAEPVRCSRYSRYFLNSQSCIVISTYAFSGVFVHIQ